MSRTRITVWIIAMCLLPGAHLAHAQPDTQPADAEPALQRIAFGSCADPRKPLPVFDTIIRHKPDLMIFVGDNVYADTVKERRIRRTYKVLGKHPAFRRLQSVCPILATWDDHDYGLNDSGAEHPGKAGSQRAFMDFWQVPQDSPRRTREGVYGAQVFGPEGRRVQVILLDTRYHRSPLTRRPERDSSRYAGRYLPNPDPAVTVLGEAQWAWLSEQLTKPADLRLIVSSIQFIAEDHGWETWAMFPAERTRLIELIQETQANGVVFLSGDRHHAEFSRLDDDAPYPIYDLTSSGLNKSGLEKDEPNRHRVGNRYHLTNFGLITVDWESSPPAIAMQIIDPRGDVRIEHHTNLAELTPPD